MQLKAGVDAAALAAVEKLPGVQATRHTVALRFATLNAASGSSLQMTCEGGTWDEDTVTFTPTDLSYVTTVRVTVLSPDTSLFFGSLLGKSFADVSASAVATSGGIGTQFLIDDEMIDKDVPAIVAMVTWGSCSHYASPPKRRTTKPS